MSAQQSNTQKGQKRHHKKPHQAASHSRSVVSDNDAYNSLVEANAGSGDGKSRPRSKSHAKKKGQIVNSDAAAYSDGSAQRPVPHNSKTQATPIKQQAYAGPTFHQSPAASALPLPSFYSKSVPTASPLKAGINEMQSPEKQTIGHDQRTNLNEANELKRETTPLDFLFDAARKAGATPGMESPNHKPYLSSAADTPTSRSPAVRDADADFPFELDASETGWEDGSAISTPYKDRIEAVRSHRKSSAGGKGLDEDERQAKTAALKQFLMNSAQNSAETPDSNPFNAKPVPPQTRQPQHRSNPNTPYHLPVYGNQAQYFPPMPPVANPPHFLSPSRPGPPSSLRNVYQPGPDPGMMSIPPYRSNDQDRISTAREKPPSRSNFADIYSSANKPSEQGPGHRATPSAQQLEDDLRKFLKLDLVSRG